MREESLSSENDRISLRLWLFLLAVGVSVLGDHDTNLGLILHASAEGNPGWYITEVALAVMLPAVLLAPWVGRLADRADPLRLWRLTLIIQAGIYASMPLLVGRFHLLILALVLVQSVEVASAAAAFKALPRFSGPERLARASGHWVTVTAAFTLPSAPLGALAYGLFGIEWLLWANAATYLLPLLALVMLKAPYSAEAVRATSSAASEEAETDAPLKQGTSRPAVLRYLRTHPVIGPLIPAVALVILSTSIEGVAHVRYLQEVSGAPMLYGIALMAWSIGMIPGGQWGGRLADEQARVSAGKNPVPLRTLVLGAGAVMGCSFILEAAVPVYALIVAGFMVGGLANGVHNVGLRTTVYQLVPEPMQGSTWTCFRAMAAGLSVLGMVLGTPSVLLSGRELVLTSGVLAAVGCAVFLVVVRRRAVRARMGAGGSHEQRHQ